MSRNKFESNGTESRDHRKEYKFPKNLLENRRAWEEWIEDLENETSYFEIGETKDKVSALKIYGSQDIKKLARNLPYPAPIADENEYQKLKQKLDGYCLPNKNKHNNRLMLSTQKPKSGESIVSSAARIRKKGKDCKFEFIWFRQLQMKDLEKMRFRQTY